MNWICFAIVLIVSSVVALANGDQAQEGAQKSSSGGGGGGSGNSSIDIPSNTTGTQGSGDTVGVPIKLNATQCIYKSEENILSCQRDSETFLECSTVGEWSMLNTSRKIHIFGLSMPRCPGAGECTAQKTVFFLYPRVPNQQSYFSHHIRTNKSNELVHLMLWGSSSGVTAGENMTGLRVTDIKCFEKLVKLNNETCRTPRTFNIMLNATASEDVRLCGEILVTDKLLQKRWWGWGGFGWGGMGWPFWGGFGSPWLWGK